MSRTGGRQSGSLMLLALGICIGSWLQPLLQSAFATPWPVSWARSTHSPLAVLSSLGRQTSVSRHAAPLIGSEAPDFTVKAVIDQDFQDLTLSSYRGEKYVVLFFYPLDFTFVCPTEIIAFSDRINEFREIGTEVLGCSVDSEYSHLAWIQMPRDDGGLGDIDYPLLSDLKKDLATSYGVLSPDGAAYRGLFIIDKAGVVQHSTINNMAFGRSVDEVLRVLKAIQYVQENPDEVCPAGWQPGDKTMRPDFEGKREYFSGE